MSKCTFTIDFSSISDDYELKNYQFLDESGNVQKKKSKLFLYQINILRMMDVQLEFALDYFLLMKSKKGNFILIYFMEKIMQLVVLKKMEN